MTLEKAKGNMSRKFWLYNLFSIEVHAIKDSPSKWGYLQSWAWGQYLYLSRWEWTQYCLKWKKKLQLRRLRKALGIPTKTCAKLFKKRVEVEFRKHRICWNIYPPIVPIVAMIGSKTPSSQLSSLRLSSCFSASHSMLVLASMSTGKRLAQLQVQVVFSAISSHQEEGTTRPPSLR